MQVSDALMCRYGLVRSRPAYASLLTVRVQEAQQTSREDAGPVRIGLLGLHICRFAESRLPRHRVRWRGAGLQHEILGRSPAYSETVTFCPAECIRQGPNSLANFLPLYRRRQATKQSHKGAVCWHQLPSMVERNTGRCICKL